MNKSSGRWLLVPLLALSLVCGCTSGDDTKTIETRTVELPDNCEPAPPIINNRSATGSCIEGVAEVEIEPDIDAACDLTPTVTIQNGLRDTLTDIYPFGTTFVTITATDDILGVSSTRQMAVNVEDNTPPTVEAGGDVTVECRNHNGTNVALNTPSGLDSCEAEENLTFTNDAREGGFLKGLNKVTFTATDSSGNAGTDSYTVVVEDTTPPTIDAGDDLVLVAQGNCNGGQGTTVMLPLPRATDRCTQNADIGLVNSLTDSNAREVCLTDNQTTTVTWTAVDAEGLRTSDSVDITVADGDFAVNITNNPTTAFTNQPVTVAFEAVGAAAPVEWAIFGGEAPTTAPGNGAQAEAVFSEEGTYCPLYITARDNANKIGANGSPCFGIDRTAPIHDFDQLPTEWFAADDINQIVATDADDESTWPVIYAGEAFRIEFRARDNQNNQDARSGIASVSVKVDPDGDSRTFFERSWNASGTPARANRNRRVPGCTTPDAACREDGQIEAAELGTGPHVLEIQITDTAGNVATSNYYFRVKDFGQASDDFQDWAQALRGDSPLAARRALLEAKQSLDSSARLFSEAPGYGFLISRRAWQRLDDAEANDAEVNNLKVLIARAMAAEVTRLIDATDDRDFIDWNPLDIPDVDTERYLTRPLLFGKDNYTLNVDETLGLARDFSAQAYEKLGEGRTLVSIDASIDAFDTLAILFDDQTLANALGREPNTLDNGDVEGLFRNSGVTEWGLPIAQSLENQIRRVQTDPLIPNQIKNTLAQAKNELRDFERGVRKVGSPRFTNQDITEEVFLTAIRAFEHLASLSESSIYTYQWQAEVMYTLTFVINFSLYEGPTSITQSDPNRSRNDPQVQVAECRYDRMVQAIVDGRLDNGVLSARNTFLDSKCLMIDLYNSYYGNIGQFPQDRPIDPTDHGCSGDPVEVDPQAECPCALGNTSLVDDSCNGIDEDCDGTPDDNFEGETCGLGACAGQATCRNGQVTDCTPGEAIGLIDATCDNIDDDCDGEIDDDYETTSCGQFGCASTSSCINGNENPCVPGTPTEEVCDNRDNDCNGLTDEGLDADRDGYGPTGTEGCFENGADCDDTNFRINPGAEEICNGIDDNCNGQIDEGVKNACGTCGSDCTVTEYGIGDTRIPFNPTPNNSQNVVRTDEGAVGLSSQEIDVRFAWFVASGDNQIVKIDTTTGKQVGRYITGTDPSRTAVDSKGNVFIANRRGGSATKIANWTELCDTDLNRCECRDNNNNGTIETAKDANGNGVIDNSEYLGARDECHLWTTRPGGLGYYPRSLSIDEDGNPWVGNWASAPRQWKLDPETGDVLASYRTSIRSYGSVIDPNGIIWFGDRSGQLQSIDTNTGQLGPVRRQPGRRQSYGLGMDGEGNIYQGVVWGSPMIARYNTHRERQNYHMLDTRDWVFGPIIPGRENSRGVTVDSQGKVWVTHWDRNSNNARHVTGFIMPGGTNTFQTLKTATMDSRCRGVLGIGTGSQGNLWVSCYNTATTAVFSQDPNSQLINYHPIGRAPYTYSDFTGNIRAVFTAPRGEYSQVVKGCRTRAQNQGWNQAVWDADVPTDTEITAQYRVARLRSQLSNATFSDPTDARTLDLSGLDSDNFLEIKFNFVSRRQGQNPTLNSLIVSRFCAEP